MASEKMSTRLRNRLGDPRDVENAIFYAVTELIHVDIADIVVWAAKYVDL